MREPTEAEADDTDDDDVAIWIEVPSSESRITATSSPMCQDILMMLSCATSLRHRSTRSTTLFRLRRGSVSVFSALLRLMPGDRKSQVGGSCSRTPPPPKGKIAASYRGQTTVHGIDAILVPEICDMHINFFAFHLVERGRVRLCPAGSMPVVCVHSSARRNS